MPTNNNTVTNVTAGKPKIGGAIYRAPLSDSLTLPTDESSSLAAAFACVGYISEDGVTNSNSMDTDNIKAWGGDVVLALQTDKEDTFKFTMIEVLNATVLKAVFGDDNVTVTPAAGTTPAKIAVAVNSKEQPECAWVIDMILRGDKIKRIVIPDSKITEIGDVVYKDDDVVGYEVTLTAMPDEDGNTHYEYMTA